MKRVTEVDSEPNQTWFSWFSNGFHQLKSDFLQVSAPNVALG